MDTISNIAFIIFIYYICLSLWYIYVLFASFPQVLRRFNEGRFGNAHRIINEVSLIPITVITPVYNEKNDVMNFIHSIFNSDYKNIHLILVNDGSTDDTLAFLQKELLLYEIPLTIKQTIKTELVRHCFKSKRFNNVMVLDKDHSPFNCGADAVNAGLNACKTPYVLTIDADTILEPDALTRILLEVMTTPHCIVVSGSLYVLNDNIVENGSMITTQFPKHFIPGQQALEYLRSFLYGRAGLNALNGAMCFPGAFTLFETEILHEVKGFDRQNFAYDAEITTKIHHYMLKKKYPYVLTHAPNAFGWTDVPNTLNSFWKQRNKWQRGMLRSLFRHIGMLYNPKYGFIGLVTFPFYIFFDTFGFVIEFLSLIILIPIILFGAITLEDFIWFIILAWGYLTFLTVAILFLNAISFNKFKRKTDMLRAIWMVTIEMFGFRQFRATCCTVATIQYLINRIRGKPL